MSRYFTIARRNAFALFWGAAESPIKRSNRRRRHLGCTSTALGKRLHVGKALDSSGGGARPAARPPGNAQIPAASNPLALADKAVLPMPLARIAVDILYKALIILVGNLRN